MKYLAYITILVILSDCSQKKSTLQDEKVPYVMNPDPNDSLCMYDIERAKKDIRNGKIVFTESMGLGSGEIRYEAELKKLCIEKGLIFDYDLISCLVFEGQTQGCYGAYMNEIIEEKFGAGFKERLHIQADSLFLADAIAQNTVVESWNCDEQPKLPNEGNGIDHFLPNISTNEIKISGKNGEWPFFDLRFVVEKDSTISNFHISNFLAVTEENEKHKDKLFSIAVRHLQTNYPLWVPGKIKEVPVRTGNHVRVYLTN